MRWRCCLASKTIDDAIGSAIACTYFSVVPKLLLEYHYLTNHSALDAETSSPKDSSHAGGQFPNPLSRWSLTRCVSQPG